MSAMSRPSVSLLALLVCVVTGLGLFTMQPHAQSSSRAVKHVVVFKYKPEATPAQIQQVTDAFRALATKIPGITGFEDGVNNSPEGLNQGFTHVYVLTFTDAAARDAYLPHPDHKAFGALLGKSGIFAGAFVVDYAPNVVK